MPQPRYAAAALRKQLVQRRAYAQDHARCRFAWWRSYRIADDEPQQFARCDQVRSGRVGCDLDRPVVAFDREPRAVRLADLGTDEKASVLELAALGRLGNAPRKNVARLEARDLC